MNFVSRQQMSVFPHEGDKVLKFIINLDSQIPAGFLKLTIN